MIDEVTSLPKKRNATTMNNTLHARKKKKESIRKVKNYKKANVRIVTVLVTLFHLVPASPRIEQCGLKLFHAVNQDYSEKGGFFLPGG